MDREKLIVVGGGAAGFFCAVNAARFHPEVDVVLLEKTSKILSKVKVSGGGRCNVTHACFSVAELSKKYPRGESFLKKALHHFSTTDTIKWFEDRSVKLKTEPDGRMFPITNDSQTIINCLLREANNYGVSILLNTGVEAIEKIEGKFKLSISGDRTETAQYVCIASGGYPKSAQFDWLTAVGHTIQSPVPSLFTFNVPGHKITNLMGISVPEVQVKIMGTKLQQSGPLLITHWGLSGPAILKSSAYAARILAEKNYAYSIQVNWLTSYNEQSLKDRILKIRFEMASTKISNRNPFELPSRLWEYFLHETGINPEIRWADLPAKEQNKLVQILCSQHFEVKGKTAFKEEFVTAGGINLDEIDPATMESKKVKGLYFAGEVMDVDGITGGFNFQNAWTSGWIAARLGKNVSG